MDERLTWKEIKEKYPHKWVLLYNTEFNESGSNIISAILVSVTDDFSQETRNWRLKNRGYYYTYTSFGDGRVKTMWGYE